MTFEKESDFEASIIKLLRERFGWGDYPVLRHPTEQDLIDNWAKILYENNRGIDRLNDSPLTPGEMKQILDQIRGLRTPLALNGFINGKTVSIVRDNPADARHFGQTVSLSIYDRLEIAAGKSRYQIAEQPEFPSSGMTHDRRGDLMLLINGMPVIHVELKKTGVPVSQAYYQIENYAHEGVFSGLFSLVQVFVAMNPDETVYFANPGPDGTFNKDFYFHWADFYNEPINDWAKICEHLLSIPMAHQLIGFYTVADDTDGLLKVMRSYQFYTAREVTNRVSQTRWADHELYGGFVWHTTGSGKTLTSFKCAQLVSESGLADKVVFLLNRIELGTQTLRDFRGFADDATDVQQTENTDILVGKLKSDEGSDALIVTSIQKMSRIREGDAKAADLAKIRQKRIVFIVDEAHQDTFGEMLATIKATFPAALYFGFTGTPIHEENQRNHNTTQDVFGKELHRYSIADGIRDKNVLGFDPNMGLTFEDGKLRKAVALEKARAATEEEALADAHKRLIYQKYMSAVPMDEIEGFIPDSQYNSDAHRGKVVESIVQNWNRLSVLGKFHAILATSSIPEAFAYYRLLKQKMPVLKATVLVDDTIDNDGSGTAKSDALTEELVDYNARYHKNFKQQTYGAFKKDVALRLAHKGPYRGVENRPAEQIDLIIVVNQMLTGYDSKWINTLYLDKMLEYARIIQAFSRTNRLFGPDKPFGTIMYYRRPHTMKRNIEEAIRLYSGDRAFGVFANRLPGNLRTLNSIYNGMVDLFKNAGIEDLSRLPPGTDEQALFARRFREFNEILNAAKVQGFRWEKREYSVEENGKVGVLRMNFTDTEYGILHQRYRELFTGGGGGGGGGGHPPFEIDPTLVHVGTGLVDVNYMNSRFRKFMKALHEGADTATVLEELHKSFAILSQEEQRFAQQFLDDVLSGAIAPDDGKTLRDYITEYQTRAKNDLIHKFAAAFGADEDKLRELMETQVSAANLNAYGKLEALLETVDYVKAAQYFTSLDGILVSEFRARSRTDEFFRKFILEGGFPLPTGKALPVREEAPEESDWEGRMAAFEDKDA